MTKQDLITILAYYKAMGFREVVMESGAVPLSVKPTFTEQVTSPEQQIDLFALTDLPVSEGYCRDMAQLRESIRDCCRCKLHSTRTNIVFGEGNCSAELMFIGEAPGADEDLQGRPFVGKAGQLLTNLIVKLGLSREIVYIANIVKCRPPNNRDPEEDEKTACMPYLKNQIQLIRPKVIIALGKVSAHKLMNTPEPISKFSIMKARGKLFYYRDGELSIPVMPTYHPSYLLRNPQAKWDVWKDANVVMEMLKKL